MFQFQFSKIQSCNNIPFIFSLFGCLRLDLTTLCFNFSVFFCKIIYFYLCPYVCLFLYFLCCQTHTHSLPPSLSLSPLFLPLSISLGSVCSCFSDQCIFPSIFLFLFFFLFCQRVKGGNFFAIVALIDMTLPHDKDSETTLVNYYK